MPAAYAELELRSALLERHYRDMQDIEFTVESGRLYILQTRGAKRTATAALRSGRDMVDEGLLTRTRRSSESTPRSSSSCSIRRSTGRRPERSRHRSLRLTRRGRGAVVFDADSAAARGAAGESVLLVRPETTADDIHGLLRPPVS